MKVVVQLHQWENRNEYGGIDSGAGKTLLNSSLHIIAVYILVK